MAALTSIPESQFAYVVVVSRRARQLMIGGRPMIDNPKSRKTSRIAEEELQLGPPRIFVAGSARGHAGQGRQAPQVETVS